MKLLYGTTLALLLVGAPAYAQEPDKDKPKDEPRQEEPKKNEAPKKGRQEEPKEKPRQEPDRRPEDRAKPAPAQQNDHAQQQQQEQRNRNEQKAQQDRAQEQQRAQQTQQHTDRDNHARENHPENRGNARRIPEEKYRVSFGREHHFHVPRGTDRRFQYSGFWFTYSDPWPGDWDYDDDVYIEEIDGEYYLIQSAPPWRPHPRDPRRLTDATNSRWSFVEGGKLTLSCQSKPTSAECERGFFFARTRNLSARNAIASPYIPCAQLYFIHNAAPIENAATIDSHTVIPNPAAFPGG